MALLREAAGGLSITRLWFSNAPLEKFRRATFIPARRSSSMIAGESDAGPMVQTIWVQWAGRGVVRSRSAGSRRYGKTRAR